MAIDLKDTRTLLGVLEQSFAPTTLFRDTFFPNEITFVTNEVEMEYKKGGRTMSPFVAPRSKGINSQRNGSTIKNYKPPIMKPKRVLDADDISKRSFGENIYSTKTPAQRAAELLAGDLADLLDMNTRRVEWMCAQLLINGSFEVQGYADDGKVAHIDTVSYSDWTQKETLAGSDTWDNVGADIYGDLKFVSQTVSRNSGETPTIAICSYNVENYILKNDWLMKWLAVPTAQNLSLMSIQPRIVSPGVRRIGFIQSLNLELYAYDGVYQDDSGVIQQYLPDNHIVVGVPGRGKQLFGAITQMEKGGFVTFEGTNVPKITSDEESDTQSLSLSSRCVPCPAFADDWYTLKVK